jgi:hypothetical protein
VTILGWQILYALFYEIEHFNPESYPLINEAARLEVETHWPIAVPFGPGIKASIWLFCRTSSGHPEESAILIRKMLTSEELSASGYFRGNQVADGIVAIARCHPDLAVEIYERLYSFREMGPEMVPMGDSVVMAMQMSRHDMYGSCHHNLEKGLPTIFETSPHTATRAVCRALRGKKHAMDEPVVRFVFNDAEIKTSNLPIYSEHLDQKFSEQTRLLAAWCECLRRLPRLANASDQWLQVSEALIQDADSPDMWAALLTVATEEPGFFGGTVWPMLHSPDLLSCWRFKKFLDPCVASLARTAGDYTLNTWQAVVLSIGGHDVHGDCDTGDTDGLEVLKASYLLLLPDAGLTEASRLFLAQCKPKNVRPYHPSHSRQRTEVERMMAERERNGLDPTIPLHLKLEKDLAIFRAPNPQKVGPSILKKIAEIEVRFATADSEVQTRLRGQFQNGFSWALRELANGANKLTEEQLHDMLGLCKDLLDTNAGRDNALEAIGLALSKRRKLTKTHRHLLRHVAERCEPAVVEHFGHYVWAFLKTYPDFVWECLARWTSRMGEDEIAKALPYTLHDSWFWWLYQLDKQRALDVLEEMLTSGRQANRKELVAGFMAWFAAVAITEGEGRSRKLIEEALSDPMTHATEMSDVVRVLVEWYMPRDPTGVSSTVKLQRASALTDLFFNSAIEALQNLHQQQSAMPLGQRQKEPFPWRESIAHQFDHFATELRFSAESHAKSSKNKSAAEFTLVGDAWWVRAEPLFSYFEKWLHPHIGNDLINALAEWFPHYPKRCLTWLRKLCEAGTRTGLLFERFVVSDIIKILQHCLAEHRALLGSDKSSLQDFAAILESLLNTANVEALGMAASLDEFYR